MRTRFAGYGFCEGAWLYRVKISKKFGESEVGGACWWYRGPIGRDDGPEWLVLRFYGRWLLERRKSSILMVESWRKM